MGRVVTGVDVGHATAVAVRGRFHKNTFQLEGFAVGHASGAGLASSWAALEPGFKLGATRVGLSGKEINVRYTRVPRVPDWQLRKLMRFEVEEVGGTSGADVASDFNLLPSLPEIEGEDVVLLAMARTRLLDEHLEGLRSAGGSLDCFSPAALGLYNAWLRYGVVQDDTVLLANIGHDSIDVVITRGADLVFARNLSGGGRLFDEAIAQRLGVSPEQARTLKEEYATLRPGAHHPTPNHEKASRAILGAAGQLLSLLQSSVLFCKTQVKLTNLKLDRVLLCGGGAALDGLPEYLSAGLNVGVDLFDPWRVVDTARLDEEDQDTLESYKLEAVVALGLATMATDAEGYSLEILPPAVARARKLWGRQAFLLAAALLAVVYLGFYAVRSKQRAGEYGTDSQRLSAQLKKKRDVDRRTRELLDENERLAASSAELQRIVGSGEQMARTLEFLARNMPDDFWMTRLEGRWTVDEELGIDDGEPRPVVLLQGALRQGAGSSVSLYQGMVDALGSNLPGVRSTSSFDRNTFKIDLTTFADEPAGEAPVDGEGEDA